MIELMDHQKAALESSKDKDKFAFLMDIGTGKTITALQDSLRLYNDSKLNIIVIICPSVIVSHWVQEIKFYYNGTFNYNVSIIKTPKAIVYYRDSLNIYILNIEALSRKTTQGYKAIQSLAKFKPDRSIIVLDESSKIKNTKANRTKILLKVSNEFKYARILTGTPITERSLDAYSQFQFLSPSILSMTELEFADRFAKKVTSYNGAYTYTTFIGTKNLDQLVALIAPHSFACRREDCLQLPDKIHNDYFVEITENSRRLYDQLKKDFIYEYTNQEGSLDMVPMSLAIQRLHKFQEIVNQDNAKFDAILDIVEQHSGDLVIIWCTHHVEIDQVYFFLKGLNIKSRRLSGTHPLQSDLSSDIMIIMQQYGSFGLNLQRYNINIYFNTMFSYEQRIQSEGRTFRQGQEKQVFYYNLIAKDTIDERIQSVIGEKRINSETIMQLL